MALSEVSQVKVRFGSERLRPSFTLDTLVIHLFESVPLEAAFHLLNTLCSVTLH